MTGGDDLLALPLAFRAHLGDERGTLLLRLLAQPRGLVPSLGELCLVLLKDALGLDLHGVGLFDIPAEELHTAQVDETWIAGERVFSRLDPS